MDFNSSSTCAFNASLVLPEFPVCCGVRDSVERRMRKSAGPVSPATSAAFGPFLSPLRAFFCTSLPCALCNARFPFLLLPWLVSSVVFSLRCRIEVVHASAQRAGECTRRLAFSRFVLFVRPFAPDLALLTISWPSFSAASSSWMLSCDSMLQVGRVLSRGSTRAFLSFRSSSRTSPSPPILVLFGMRRIEVPPSILRRDLDETDRYLSFLLRISLRPPRFDLLGGVRPLLPFQPWFVPFSPVSWSLSHREGRPFLIGRLDNWSRTAAATRPAVEPTETAAAPTRHVASQVRTYASKKGFRTEVGAIWKTWDGKRAATGVDVRGKPTLVRGEGRRDGRGPNDEDDRDGRTEIRWKVDEVQNERRNDRGNVGNETNDDEGRVGESSAKRHQGFSSSRLKADHERWMRLFLRFAIQIRGTDRSDSCPRRGVAVEKEKVRDGETTMG